MRACRSSGNGFVAFHLIARLIAFALLDVDADAHWLVVQLCAVLQLPRTPVAWQMANSAAADLFGLLVRVADVQAITNLTVLEFVVEHFHVSAG